MVRLRDIYAAPLGLLTDLYQVTMAFGYWKLGMAERNSVFHLFFRKNPFEGGFTISAGLEYIVDYLRDFRIEKSVIEYLAGLEGNDGSPLFDPGFLDYLGEMRLSIDVDAVLEGTAVFPQEPLLRVKGPLVQCQLLETALLNIINFQTLIATKAARICMAAGDDPVVEFGLRRAQGIDGALAATRASYIGGCSATSNVLAGKLFGIPVKGTHAHSWVMAFDDELTAFDEYAEAMPNNCVFLVDTYDTLEGVRRAAHIGLKLKQKGHKMVGVRLDSGDLAYLSIQARKILDEAGLQDAVIVASNDLDERLITSLKLQGAKIGLWGIGTKLVTAYDQPALGGVYKLGAIEDANGAWLPKVKLSEQSAKTTIPGVLQVRRYFNAGRAVADQIYNVDDEPNGEPVIVDPMDPNRKTKISMVEDTEDLLLPVIRDGNAIYECSSLDEIQNRTRSQLSLFHSGILRFDYPHEYPVGLESRLFALRNALIEHERGTPEI